MSENTIPQKQLKTVLQAEGGKKKTKGSLDPKQWIRVLEMV